MTKWQRFLDLHLNKIGGPKGLVCKIYCMMCFRMIPYSSMQGGMQSLDARSNISIQNHHVNTNSLWRPYVMLLRDPSSVASYEVMQVWIMYTHRRYILQDQNALCNVLAWEMINNWWYPDMQYIMLSIRNMQLYLHLVISQMSRYHRVWQADCND